MAAPSSCTNISNSSLVNNKLQPHQLAKVPAHNKHSECSFLRVDRTGDLRFTSTHDKESNRYRGILVIRKATPEVVAAGDVVSALSIPGIPFSIPMENPWMAAFAGLFIGVPFVIQRLLALSKQVDMAAETMEKIADTVGKVAEEVDKAAEELGESLPEGGLKQMVALVEDMAEETVKDAQVVEDLMDKVGELDDKLEALRNKQSKEADKAA